MHLLLVTGIFPPEPGGPATYTYEIARHFSASMPVTVIAFVPNPTPLSGVNVIGLRTNYPFLGGFFRQYRLFRTLLLHMRPDSIIYAQEPVIVGLMTRFACRLRGMDYFVKFVGDASWENAFFSGKTSKSLDEFLENPDGGWVAKLRSRIQQYVFRGAKKIVVPSHYLKRVVHDHYKIPDSHIQVIVNAISIERIHSLPVAAQHQHSIVTVGRLVGWKNIAGILEALARMKTKTATLKIIGSGPESSTLINLSKKLNIENRVFFLGRLSHEATLHEVAKSQLFVLNSVYEGLPHTVLEAMALRTAVVATHIPGTDEIALHEKTALTVPPHDDGALADALDRLLNDTPLREKLIHSAFEMIERDYIWDQNVRDLSQTLQLTPPLPKILMLSHDPSLLKDSGASGDTLKRFEHYAKNLESLVVLVPTHTPHLHPRIHHNIHIIPCYAPSVLRFFSVYRAALSQLKKNRFDLIITNDAVLGWLGVKLKRRFKTKLQISVFGLEVFNEDWLSQRRLNHFLANIQIRALTNADSIRSDTQLAKEIMIDRLSIPKNRIHVIPVSPSDEMIQIFKHSTRDELLRERLIKTPHDKLVLTVTAFETCKNVPLFVEAAALIVAKNPLVRFLVVGEGGQEAYVRDLITKKSLNENVFLLGRLPYDQLASLYRSVDLFVLSSLHEGLPRVFMEAGLAALPVVSTDGVFGAPDLIITGKSGLIVPNKNPEALAQAIDTILQNPELGKRLGSALRDRVVTYCDFKTCLTQLMDSWDRAINS